MSRHQGLGEPGPGKKEAQWVRAARAHGHTEALGAFRRKGSCQPGHGHRGGTRRRKRSRATRRTERLIRALKRGNASSFRQGHRDSEESSDSGDQAASELVPTLLFLSSLCYFVPKILTLETKHSATEANLSSTLPGYCRGRGRGPRENQGRGHSQNGAGRALQVPAAQGAVTGKRCPTVRRAPRPHLAREMLKTRGGQRYRSQASRRRPWGGWWCPGSTGQHTRSQNTQRTLLTWRVHSICENLCGE